MSKFIIILIACISLSNISFADKNYPDVIFFDWDGTVSDNSENLSFAFGNALLKYGITKDELNMIRDNERHGNVDYIWEWAEKRFDKPTFDAMEKHYHYLYREVAKINYTLVPGVVDFLEELKKKKIPSIVISNRNGNAVRLEAKRNNLIKYFNGVFGEHDFKGIVKPNVDFMKLSAQKSSIKYNSCWIIGDGDTDIEIGIASGCKMFFVGKKAVLEKKEKYRGLIKDGLIIHTDYTNLLHLLRDVPDRF
jgi:phosphoglycolate phosphatase-like HAD superfamily hydrolase